MLMMKFIVASVSFILLIPSISSAEKVIVVRGTYTLTFENETSKERATLVADSVFAALKRIDRLQPVALELECTDGDCLKKAASDAGADIALMVTVEEGAALYNFKVITPDNSVEGEASGRFNEAVKKITDSALDVVSDAIAKTSSETSAPKNEASLPASEEASPSTAMPPPPSKNEKSRPSPAVWTCFSITAASAVTWGILHGIGSAKLNDYEDKTQQDRTLSEKNQLENLRISTLVMIGVTSTAFVTTGIVFFVTHHKKKVSGAVSFLPVLAPGAGALMLRGSF